MTHVARKNMVDCQIRPNKVTDGRLLDAFEAVPREQFVLASQRGFAYVDTDLATNAGRSVMESMVLARLMQAAAIGAQDKVLVVGCDFGYTVAVTLHLTPHVTGVDHLAGIMKVCEANLEVVGLKAKKLHVAPINEGCSELAPYNVIILNGSADVVPVTLFEQLAENGRLVGVINQISPTGVEVGYATVYTKKSGVIDAVTLFETNVPVLDEFIKNSKFKF